MGIYIKGNEKQSEKVNGRKEDREMTEHCKDNLQRATKTYSRI